jgi:hypothetical protein
MIVDASYFMAGAIIRGKIRELHRNYQGFVPYSGGVSENGITQVLTRRKNLTIGQALIWSENLDLPLEIFKPFMGKREN